MVIYPRLDPIVIYNGINSFTGVWKVQRKHSSNYLFYSQELIDKTNTKVHCDNLESSLELLQRYVDKHGGYHSFTLYSTDSVDILDVLRWLAKFHETA